MDVTSLDVPGVLRDADLACGQPPHVPQDRLVDGAAHQVVDDGRAHPADLRELAPPANSGMVTSFAATPTYTIKTLLSGCSRLPITPVARTCSSAYTRSALMCTYRTANALPTAEHIGSRAPLPGRPSPSVT